jgi:SAM-dependent methyltransferase
MLKNLVQDLFMIPMHAVEGAAVRWGFAEPLYQLLGKMYDKTRQQQDFGENYFQNYVRHGRRLLDLGCGPGTLTGLLRERFETAVGLDLSWNMIRKAAELEPQSEFVRGDMIKLPFGQGTFDAVVSLGAIHCVDYNFLAREIARVLAPGGEVHLLFDNKITPLFLPGISGTNLIAALASHGFARIESFKVGRLYLYVKAERTKDQL